MRLIDADDVYDSIAERAGIELYPSEWKSVEDAIDSVPTAIQLWTSVKDAQPPEDGIYFVTYDFWHFQNCISTRKFKDGEWPGNRYPVKFWMPIPTLPEDNA